MSRTRTARVWCVVAHAYGEDHDNTGFHILPEGTSAHDAARMVALASLLWNPNNDNEHATDQERTDDARTTAEVDALLAQYASDPFQALDAIPGWYFRAEERDIVVRA